MKQPVKIQFLKDYDLDTYPVNEDGSAKGRTVIKYKKGDTLTVSTLASRFLIRKETAKLI